MSAPASSPTSVGSLTLDDPDEIVNHLEIGFDDPMDGLDWGVMPSVALCGFIFTTTAVTGLPSGPVASAEDCQPCQAHLAALVREGLELRA